jgi:dTDP-4-dehydrorhamnose 3,5-epimerase
MGREVRRVYPRGAGHRMIFTEAAIPGAYVIDPERLEDERGFFARTWCQREFKTQGLIPELAQCNISYNHRKGTLRGMHYQVVPHAEIRLVRCTAGAIYDVIVDIRPESKTFKRWFSIELTADNRRLLYIPEGLAHGFLTLRSDTEVFYQMSEFYSPESARGVRWDDPAFGIKWPEKIQVISERDRGYPDFVS